MQAELLALREQRRRARQPAPDARVLDPQDAFGDADRGPVLFTFMVGNTNSSDVALAIKQTKPFAGVGVFMSKLYIL
ncbi:hypothetical protein Tco_0181534 [Tanacetum coccineum]